MFRYAVLEPWSHVQRHAGFLWRVALTAVCFVLCHVSSGLDGVEGELEGRPQIHIRSAAPMFSVAPSFVCFDPGSLAEDTDRRSARTWQPLARQYMPSTFLQEVEWVVCCRAALV